MTAREGQALFLAEGRAAMNAMNAPHSRRFARFEARPFAGILFRFGR
jgi:hypothetical protein